QGQKQDLLFDTFWLMTFFESISLVGSQGITNLLLDDDNKGILLPCRFAALVSVIGILYIRKAPSIRLSVHPIMHLSLQATTIIFTHVLREQIDGAVSCMAMTIQVIHHGVASGHLGSGSLIL
ncbi:hypothetical protein ZWY2020_051233, partial [Hordeum vulgare]